MTKKFKTEVKSESLAQETNVRADPIRAKLVTRSQNLIKAEDTVTTKKCNCCHSLFKRGGDFKEEKGKGEE